MFDQIIDDIVDEISLEGEEGCTFEQVFTFVKDLFLKVLKDKSLNAPILFDDNYKSYIWVHLRNLEQLIFTMNDVVIDPSDLSYQYLKEKDSASKLVIRATEESQDTSIYGSLKSEKKNLADNHKLLLGVIAKSRNQGIGQFQLAEKLDMDSKAVFYYLKKLDSLGLIVKESAYTDKMNTRIIFLKRFAKQDDNAETDTDGSYYRVGNFKDNLLKQLSNAKDNMMTLQDTIKAMGFVTHRNIRWARVRIAELHDQGVVEKFNAYDGRIAKPSVRIRNASEGIEKKEDENCNKITNIERQETFYRDFSGDYQFFQDIVASGERGLVRQDLVDKYPQIDPMIFKTFLENAVLTPKTQDFVHYTVHRAEELDGKIRIFRYFDCNGWRKFNESIGKSVTEPKASSKTKVPILEEPKSIDQIGKSFGILPRTKIPIKRLQAKKRKDEEYPTDDSNDSKLKRAKKKAAPVVTSDQGVLIQSEPRRDTRTRKTTAAIIYDSGEQEPINKRKLDSLEQEDDDYSESKEGQQSTHTPEIIVFENSSSQSQPKKIKRGSKASLLNSTKLRRSQILLDMMEKQPIRELNTDLATEFNEIEKAAAGGQKMAVLTFNKMARQLHEEKKLKIFVSSIQKQFGLTEIKTFLMHPSLSEDSEQVKQLLEVYKTERPIMESKSKRKEFKKIQVEEIPSVEEPNEEVGKSDKKGPMDSSYAFEYGWIKSRWHRSRELHESLMDYYVFSKATDHVIDMKEYIKFVSLNTLMTIVSSLPYENEDFRKFVDVEENRNQSLGEVPEDIRLLVFQSRLRIRFLINCFLRVLVALGLVKAVEETDSKYLHAIAPKYILSEEGVIRDYAFKDRAIVKTLPLKNLEDVRYFWEELQSTCVHPLRYKTKQDEEELESSVNEDDPLYHIHRNRTWVVEVVLSPKQKEILDSFIDEDSTVIPSDNAALRMHLIQTTKLTAKRIRTYYTGVMRALLKKQTKEEKLKAKLQKRLAMSADSTINDLMLASKERRKVETEIHNMKQQGPFILPTYIGSRRFRKLRARTDFHNEKALYSRGSSSTKPPAFDSLENDLLLYSYCIMKARAKAGCFFWDPVTKLLTGKNKHQCRRALNAMKRKDSGLLIMIERLIHKWEKYYKEGIEAKKIHDENPWDTLKFDLPAFVEYFILRLQEEEPIATSPLHVLPANINTLYSKYTVVRDVPLVLEAKKEEHQHSLTMGIYNENNYDNHSKISQLSDITCEVDVVKTLIKMLLMTPDYLYNSEAAYSIFNEYSQKVIEDALKSLKDEGLVIKDKSSYGRIPGRAFNVSEKFLRLAEGTLPHRLFDEARLHYTDVVSNETINLNRSISNGMAASTLALASQGKVSIFPILNNKHEKLRESLYYPKASAVSLRKAFIYKNLDIALKRDVSITPINTNVSRAQDLDAKIVVPTLEQIEFYIQGMENDFPLARIIYDAVKSLAIHGALLCDIIRFVENIEHKKVDMQQISDTICKLTSHEPPLIRIVGFEQLRYVSAEFMSSWLLKTKVDKAFINPLMWNDVTGNVIPLALNGCANTVVSHILTQPGISHANLRKRFESFFTEYELYTLIKHLKDSGIVIVRKIQRSARPKRISMFDKRPLLNTTQSNTLINVDEISCYWVSNDYYL